MPTTAHADRIERANRLREERLGSRRGKPERSFLTIAELSPAEVRTLIEGGLAVKREPQRFAQALAGKRVALLFQKTSTRTRCSFEVGVGDMGGQPLFLDWKTTNFTLGHLEDEAKVLSRYFDLIMARVYKHEDLETMKAASEVPIINGLSDRYHPCQGLTDYMTAAEFFGELDGLKIAYIGDGNNVCHSLIHGAVRLGMTIAIAHPEGYEPKPEIVAAGRELGEVILTHDPREAVEGADVVYTDTWVSMGDEEQKEVRLAAFAGYSVDEALMERAPDHALVMHCLPAHRGYEISPGVMDSANSVVFDQAENRMHLQKYLMAWILETV